jgi:hypothetical protein
VNSEDHPEDRAKDDKTGVKTSEADFPNTFPNDPVFEAPSREALPLESPLDSPVEQIHHFESIEELTAPGPDAQESPEKFQKELQAPFHDDLPAQPPAASSQDLIEELENFPAVEADPTTLQTSASGPVLDQVKDYSEKIGESPSATVAAAFPFTLKIIGKLSVEEQERISEIISRENFGFREMDLEPQFAAGKLLIPRISEFAGVMLIQALRGTAGKIEFYPSDSEPLTESYSDTSTSDSFSPSSLKLDEPQAESLPVTTGESLPQFPVTQIIDTVTATTTLHINAVEFQSSPQYQEALDALQREIKYKAHRKGAIGVTHYKVELSALSFPTRYRLMVTGSAIK